MENKTISAVSTPRGKGGVALIRISGEDSFEIACKVFKPASGKQLTEYKPNTVVYGRFFSSDGIPFDDGMAVLYKAPHSFTGEDTAELYCHGGMLVTQKLLTETVIAGAEYAGPGEFTKRAFLNGKISLSGAEAVGNIIDAVSEAGIRVSLKQMEGSLSRKIADIYSRLALLTSSVYAYIDYPDEDMTDVGTDEMKKILADISAELHRMYDSRKYGKAISEGINTVIVGRPNTGKSSLLNRLSGTDRAIVTDIAGTTRDIITEKITVGNVVLNLSDTAGIRKGGDEIEKLGIAKSEDALEKAEIVIFVTENRMTEEDKEIADFIKNAGKESVTVCVCNKSDKGECRLPGIFAYEIAISAKTGDGIDALAKAISELAGENDFGEDDEIIMSSRQFGAVARASASVDNAIAALDSFTQDIAGMDIEDAMASLGELDGREVTEEIVQNIFSHFCVGK